MRQRSQGTVLATPPAVRWPPDDTEESVAGTNLHQEAITSLRWGRSRSQPGLRIGQPAPWSAESMARRRCSSP
jgi:hypothetical protein